MERGDDGKLTMTRDINEQTLCMTVSIMRGGLRDVRTSLMRSCLHSIRRGS